MIVKKNVSPESHRHGDCNVLFLAYDGVPVSLGRRWLNPNSEQTTIAGDSTFESSAAIG